VGYVVFAGLTAYGAVESMHEWQVAGFTVNTQTERSGRAAFGCGEDEFHAGS
jgi:hypothetical protein